MPLWSKEFPPNCFNIMHRKSLHLYCQASLGCAHDLWSLPGHKYSKCFQSHIVGCVEHQIRVASVIKDANQHQHSLAIAWLDLPNAYGSVSHQLIQFALSHYHAPAEFLALVSNLYENQQAIITCTQWETKPVNFWSGSSKETPYQFQSSTPPSTYCWIIFKLCALMLVIASLPVWESFPSCSMLMTPVW